MVLRNHLDVGHAKLAVPSQAQLDILYRYLEGVETAFKELMNRISDGVEDGRYTPVSAGELEMDASEQTAFDGLKIA